MPTPTGVNYLLQFLIDCRLIPQLSNNKNQKWTFSLMSYYLLSIHWHLCFLITHGYSLSSVLTKEVRMSAGIGHQQYQFAVVLVPNEEPVRSDMTLPIAFVLAVKNVRTVFLRQTTFCSEYIEYIGQQLLVVAPLEATFERPFEFTGVAQRVLHALHCLIRSSTLLAS